MSDTDATAAVRFGRLERRGLILGLSGAQTGVLGVAVLIVVLAEYTAGPTGVLLTAPLWAPAAAAALVPVAGRPALSWLPVLGHWHVRRALAQTRYLLRLEHVTASRLTLPGIPGHLSVLEGKATGAVLVHDARTATVTAVLSVAGTGFVLADGATQERRVAGWGRVLASLCQQPAIARVQVLQRCVPGGAAPVRRWWAEHALTGASWPARVLADLVAEAAQTTDRRETLLAVAVRSPKPGARATSPQSLAVVEHILAAVADAARAVDLDVHGWVTRRRLPAVLRATFDPQGAAHADTGHDEQHAGAAVLIGPAGMCEDWASIRTDSAHHAVYWVREWPRSDVHAGFLQPLLLAPEARRALSITAEPLAAGRALRDIRRAKVEHAADAAQRARIGQLEDEATRAEAADVVRREQQLAAGHGDLRFVGLLTVSAATAEELDAACAATESAAAQAMCEIRRLVGQQGQAFAAGALPLARRIS